MPDPVIRRKLLNVVVDVQDIVLLHDHDAEWEPVDTHELARALELLRAVMARKEAHTRKDVMDTQRQTALRRSHRADT